MADQPGAEAAKVRRLLLRWYAVNGRDFWWRHATDPFTIALVEVLLRQTQADSSAAFLREFTMRCRTSADIVATGEARLSLDLQLVGLHRQRAQQLVALADHLIARPHALNGSTPELMRLPGIGRYAVTAISVFAHGRREAVVDGNLVRVFQRVWGTGAQRPELRKSARGMRHRYLVERDHDAAETLLSMASAQVGGEPLPSTRQRSLDGGHQTVDG